MSLLTFTVLGIPQPGGSKRAFYKAGMARALIIEDNHKSRPWKALVADAARQAIGSNAPLLDGALSLSIRFVYPRPRSHYRHGKNSHLLKDDAPVHKTTKPDATKLLRALEDALTGVVWRDDAQVVEQTTSKHWGEPARAEVAILPMDDEPAGGVA